MAQVTIYHNPRCSKSRQTLQLLEGQGINLRVVQYLDDPPDVAALARIVKLMGVRPIDLIRKNEQPYKELRLGERQDDDATLLAAMAAHPILIQRPIVVTANRAAVGRPPQRVLDIIDTQRNIPHHNCARRRITTVTPRCARHDQF